jgi:hypothetical protein
MFRVDNYAAVRCFVFVEGHSRREAARLWNLSLVVRTQRMSPVNAQRTWQISGILGRNYPSESIH